MSNTNTRRITKCRFCKEIGHNIGECNSTGIKIVRDFLDEKIITFSANHRSNYVPTERVIIRWLSELNAAGVAVICCTFYNIKASLTKTEQMQILVEEIKTEVSQTSRGVLTKTTRNIVRESIFVILNTIDNFNDCATEITNIRLIPHIPLKMGELYREFLRIENDLHYKGITILHLDSSNDNYDVDNIINIDRRGVLLDKFFEIKRFVLQAYDDELLYNQEQQRLRRERLSQSWKIKLVINSTNDDTHNIKETSETDDHIETNYITKNECDICYDEHLLKDFVKIQCRHQFCGQCVLKTTARCKGTTNPPNCPMCRSIVNELEYKNIDLMNEFKNLFIENILCE
jgi:hypothetical protein